MLVLGLSGFPPSALFVSFGGHALFAITTLLVAGVVRGIDAAIRQMPPDWKLIK
jgi:TRAP-type C4-dicarboxylate transport system permease large subunit